MMMLVALSIELRDSTEQQIADNGFYYNNYLETHYYNSGEIATISDPGIKDLVFTKLLEGESVPDWLYIA